ncbi:hypothetical protein Emed_007481 [Eimeria media]
MSKNKNLTLGSLALRLSLENSRSSHQSRLLLWGAISIAGSRQATAEGLGAFSGRKLKALAANQDLWYRPQQQKQKRQQAKQNSRSLSGNSRCSGEVVRPAAAPATPKEGQDQRRHQKQQLQKEQDAHAREGDSLSLLCESQCPSCKDSSKKCYSIGTIENNSSSMTHQRA